MDNKAVCLFLKVVWAAFMPPVQSVAHSLFPFYCLLYYVKVRRGRINKQNGTKLAKMSYLQTRLIGVYSFIDDI